jgi:ribonuclease P protein component
MTDLQFPKRVRLLNSSEFRRVLAIRCSVADDVLVLYGAISELDHPRLGVTVSRAVGSAVVRNRWKRAMREAFRLARHELPPLDLIAIPRAGAAPEAELVGTSLRSLATRVHKKLSARGTPAAEPASPPKRKRKTP